MYKAVTGNAPPPTPLDVNSYKKYGCPFFKMYEEPSGVFGDFSLVKSIGQIDKKVDEKVQPRVIVLKDRNEQGKANIPTPAGLINHDGPLRPLRTVRDLEEEYGRYHFASL
ncbi:hypothetical protein GQ44DRAFT_776175 [Phaeosphaeriaceae sp. PMI808]|nr:hypothetical protein GQ44DRAFT_776175 [Phaeosphaeriaceae sp. PMI808]